MITITFRDNVTDKKEAASRWNVLLTSLKAIIPVFRYIAVWERQKRGAWHMHLLVSAPTVSNKKLREYFNNYSSVSSLGIGFVKIFWTTGNDFKGIKNYLTKYLLKEAREKGVRYVGYSMNWIRKVKGQFAFLGGQARKWRVSCIMLDKMYPDVFRYFYEHSGFDFVLRTIQELQKVQPLHEFLLGNPMLQFFIKRRCTDGFKIQDFQNHHTTLCHLFLGGESLRPAFYWEFQNFSKTNGGIR